MNRAIKILLFCFGALLVFVLAAVAYWFAVTSEVSLDAGKLTLTKNCVTVLDCDGREIGGLRAGESAEIGELPDYLPNAFVAVEDKRFYRHHGLDFKRMVKAAMKNAASFSFREGASTISQQLIKNTHLSGEKTVNRKLKEIKLTRALEKRYSKREILELYLNSIYFGHSAFGLNEAARFYFGKSPAELTPAESATLAALVRSPNRYSPFRDAEKCLARRNFVLSLMAEQGYLAPAEAENAKNEPLPASPHPPEKENSYLELVYEELAERFPDARSGDVLRVHTFYEPALQAELDKIEAESDVCALVRSNTTNGVRAFRSTCGTIRRLPASTIKPLAVYGPSLQENLISPATPVLDEKVEFNGYSPANYGGKYGGYMSARHALAHSVNVPAVKLLNTLGVDTAARYLEKLGLPVEDADKTLALALGGMQRGYTLLSLADGYASFARRGNFCPSSAIARVEDENGKTLYSFSPAERNVFSEDVCALMCDMLQTAVKEGTAKKLSSLPFPVCAKTGTGGTAEGNTDAYTIAYTADDTVAVWMGNRDNSPVQATGGGLPANAASRILASLYQAGAPSPFPASEEVLELLLDREEYENRHHMLLADPLAPSYLGIKEKFRASAIPAGRSTRFSRPKIEKPLISVKNGAVSIVLCQTQYYDYIVKRECEGKISTIYKGKYRNELFDNSVCGGKRYTYTVIPVYAGVEGEAVVLPSVLIERTEQIPEDWWKE